MKEKKKTRKPRERTGQGRDGTEKDAEESDGPCQGKETCQRRQKHQGFRTGFSDELMDAGGERKRGGGFCIGPSDGTEAE